MGTKMFFKKSQVVLGVLVLGALVLAACQTTPVAATMTVPAAVMNTAAPTMPAFSEAVINVAMDAKLGNILVGANGMTLYMYTKDGPNVSNCSGGCLAAWPALLTKGTPVLGTGVDKTMVGTATMADGSMIVTYNKMPLYYWTKDVKAGDVTGQGVGGIWFVVSPDGKVIGK